MTERAPRIGDLVDDYCSRCRLILDHGVVGVVDEAIARVRCHTCLSEHPFRHARLPRQKKDKVKELFDQVLASMPRAPSAERDAAQATPEGPPAPDPDDEGQEKDPERPEIPRRPRSLHLGLREKMAELRAKAEAAGALPATGDDPPRKPKRRGRRGRGGRRGGRRRGPR